jgi:predicted ATP-grasp superfamily ATP-dependent carboligase
MAGLRILLSEGSSTSARQAITALGLKGHRIEICDPDPRCIGRFSRFVARFHRCPPLGADPQAYLAFTLDLLARERFDVLLPIHEQGLLFAKALPQVSARTAIALPSFASYARVLTKSGFSALLAELNLPQPATAFATSAADVRATARFPSVLKAAIGTASRGTWTIADAAELEAVLAALQRSGAFDDAVLVQQFVAGPVEHAQAVFCRGRLVAMHAYRQIARGAGGGPAMKESVRRPAVRAHLAAIGAHLDWHGALSVDYMVERDAPLYIDCNPRLVEPINALLSGTDLTDLLVRVSLGEAPAEQPDSRAGVRTHIALQALLGCALRGGGRRDLVSESWRLLTGRGVYADSREELTPLRWDWPSVVPALAGALWLLASPKAAARMPQTWGAHLLSAASVRAITQFRS